MCHEDDDVIMAESGLNLAELDTQDDRDLIHMVLEDANFEQELEGGSNSATVTSKSPADDVKDCGFYSDSRSVEETSPAPAEDHALSLEAWLADPEHAVILLDSTLLASLDMETDSSPAPSSASCGSVQPPCDAVQQRESGDFVRERVEKRRLTYSQWKKMRIRNGKSRTSDIS